MEKGPLEAMLKEEEIESISDDNGANEKKHEEPKKQQKKHEHAKETIIDRERKKHDSKKITDEELPSIIVDPNLYSPANKEEKTSEEQFKSKLLSLRILKETKPLIRQWEAANLKKGAVVEHISTPTQAIEFLNWARKEKALDIESTKKLSEIYSFMLEIMPLPEKTKAELPEAEMALEPEEPGPTTSYKKLTRDNSESDKLLKTIEGDPEVKKIFDQWKEESEDVIGDTTSKEEVIEFLDWAMSNKKIDFSQNETAWDLYLKLNGNKAARKFKENDEHTIAQISQNISNLPTESNILGSEGKTEKLRSQRQQISDLYGVTLDEDGNPATPKDEARVAKLLGLVDAEVKKVQRGGFFGKIKGFFQDIGSSEKDKMKASAFKKDLSEYTHFMLENAQPKYTTHGPVGRSIIREKGSVSTSVGSIETSRYRPLRRETPKKRGRPRKAKT